MRPVASRCRQQGFSLLEVLIALSIFVMVLVGLYQIFDANRAIHARGRGKIDVQQNARAAIDEIAREIRMAGYFPENFASPAPLIPLINPIQVGTDSLLAVYGDADASGASNVFLYCLSGSTILRVKSPSGVQAAYTCGGGQVLAENITSLRFTYYDATNTPIPNPPNTPYVLDGEGPGAVPPFASTTQRQALRSVLVTLTASENVAGQAPQTVSLTSNVRLRNIN